MADSTEVSLHQEPDSGTPWRTQEGQSDAAPKADSCGQQRSADAFPWHEGKAGGGTSGLNYLLDTPPSSKLRSSRRRRLRVRKHGDAASRVGATDRATSCGDAERGNVMVKASNEGNMSGEGSGDEGSSGAGGS